MLSTSTWGYRFLLAILLSSVTVTGKSTVKPRQYGKTFWRDFERQHREKIKAIEPASSTIEDSSGEEYWRDFLMRLLKRKRRWYEDVPNDDCSIWQLLQKYGPGRNDEESTVHKTKEIEPGVSIPEGQLSPCLCQSPRKPMWGKIQISKRTERIEPGVAIPQGQLWPCQCICHRQPMRGMMQISNEPVPHTFVLPPSGIITGLQQQLKLADPKMTRFQCASCKELFLSKEELEQHFETYHHRKRYNQCRLCGMVSLNSEELSQHTELHHSEEMDVECVFCKMRFVKNKELKEHVKSCHIMKNRFACNLCAGTSFSELDELNNHMRARHSEKRYACNLCAKLFSKQRELNDHVGSSHSYMTYARKPPHKQPKMVTTTIRPIPKRAEHAIPRRWYHSRSTQR